MQLKPHSAPLALRNFQEGIDCLNEKMPKSLMAWFRII
jgi:hypothetical protein